MRNRWLYLLLRLTVDGALPTADRAPGQKAFEEINTPCGPARNLAASVLPGRGGHCFQVRHVIQAQSAS
jgi:hypothetical protein